MGRPAITPSFGRMFCGVGLDTSDVAAITGGSVISSAAASAFSAIVAVTVRIDGTEVTASVVVVVLVDDSETCGGNVSASIAPLFFRWICRTVARVCPE